MSKVLFHWTHPPDFLWYPSLTWRPQLREHLGLEWVRPEFGEESAQSAPSTVTFEAGGTSCHNHVPTGYNHVSLALCPMSPWPSVGWPSSLSISYHQPLSPLKHFRVSPLPKHYCKHSRHTWRHHSQVFLPVHPPLRNMCLLARLCVTQIYSGLL